MNDHQFLFAEYVTEGDVIKIYGNLYEVLNITKEFDTFTFTLGHYYSGDHKTIQCAFDSIIDVVWGQSQ